MRQSPLPPGQYEIQSFPRFGLPHYAARKVPDDLTVKLRVSTPFKKEPLYFTQQELSALQRIEQRSDFHCVTSWTKRDLLWSGYRFKDFYQTFIQAKTESKSTDWVIFKGHDGFRAVMLLQDLLKQEVLLADQLDNRTLCQKHGGPLRLVAPAHYGYKSVKYLRTIEFCSDLKKFRPPAFRFMDHPRARVVLEERGRWLPGRLLAIIYRPFIKRLIKRFESSE